MAFVPSTCLFDAEGIVGSTKARGWQFRFNLKDILSGYGDGLFVLTGAFQLNVSTVPEAEGFFDATLDALGADKNFDLYYVTDQVAEISASGFRLTPVW